MNDKPISTQPTGTLLAYSSAVLQSTFPVVKSCERIVLKQTGTHSSALHGHCVSFAKAYVVRL